MSEKAIALTSIGHQQFLYGFPVLPWRGSGCLPMSLSLLLLLQLLAEAVRQSVACSGRCANQGRGGRLVQVKDPGLQAQHGAEGPRFKSLLTV